MGAIARLGTPSALKLFRKVLAASASVPGLYPAVRILSNSTGKPIEELHTDGGVARQIFILPDAILMCELANKADKNGPTDLYLIINNEYVPAFQMSKQGSFSAVGRAYSTLIKSSYKQL